MGKELREGNRGRWEKGEWLRGGKRGMVKGGKTGEWVRVGKRGRVKGGERHKGGKRGKS
jgi:hypothetical protein